MVTVDEICALTSRKFVVQRSKNLWKTKIALVILPLFCFREYTMKKLNFWTFLPLKNTLVATFNEVRAPTSRKNVAEQGILMPNSLETNQYF